MPAPLVAGTTSALGSGAVTISGGTLRLGTAVNGFGGNGPASITYPGSGTSWSGTANGWTVTSDTITSAPFTSTNVLQLTANAANQTRNAFYTTQVPVGSSTSGFATQFVYQPASAVANGAVFILQNSSSGAAAAGYPASAGTTNGGTGGSGMGFSGIFPSVGFEINLLASSTVGVSWETNGMTNSIVSPAFTAVSGINFASGDPILVNLSYNPANTTLTANFTDQTTGATGSYTNSSINVASVLGGSLAYVGFGARDRRIDLDPIDQQLQLCRRRFVRQQRQPDRWRHFDNRRSGQWGLVGLLGRHTDDRRRRTDDVGCHRRHRPGESVI